MKLEFENMAEYMEFIQTINNNPIGYDVGKMVVKIAELEKQVKELSEENLILNNKLVKEEQLKEAKSPKTIRKYTKSIIEKVPTINYMTDEGKFCVGNGSIANWTMETLLKLKARIPQTTKYPSWTEVSNGIDLSYFTIQYLCYGIEIGLFDKYFKEWEQLQANQFYGKWKPPVIENNPQKRRELGRI